MAATLPGISRLILVADEKHNRYSEADVVELSDGRLLLALGRKDGSSDFSPGTLIGMFSRDRGVTWDDQPHIIQGPFDDVGDLMSVSLCRTSRGVHLFFLGRGPETKKDTRVYQMISSDEGKSWGKPIRVSERPCYHVVNNARVIRSRSGRMIVPSAFLEAAWEQHDSMGVYVLFSDDEGTTWKRSNDLTLTVDGKAHPLMEPGVAQCADGSLYMTIRTKEGVLYEARSRDDGTTWQDFAPTKLQSPAAPSTVVRSPDSDALWMFWINREAPTGGTWKLRTPLCFGASRDHGKTWGDARAIEDAPDHSYGYYSFTWVDGQALLTYYDWHDKGQPNFKMTNLRQRVIPRDWFAGKATPPVFRANREPVLSEKGEIVSANSGLLVEKDRWRLWYTQGPEKLLRIHSAESTDAGVTWTRLGPTTLEGVGEKASTYHPSVHRVGDAVVMYLWRMDAGDDSGLYRYISSNDGKTFAADPATPLMVSNWTKAQRVKEAGEGRVSNDAFDVISGDNLWEYYAACLEKATDPRTIITHDNAAGWLRFIGRSACADGVSFPPPEIVLRRYDEQKDPADLQFYGIQVFRRRGFYLGLLHAYHVDSQVIAPEWAWSHDGLTWARTRIKAISLGDEGSFDRRMIVFGAIAQTAHELVWLYAGNDWRHNTYDKAKSRSCIGRATLALRELDAWLETLPHP